MKKEGRRGLLLGEEENGNNKCLLPMERGEGEKERKKAAKICGPLSRKSKQRRDEGERNRKWNGC